VHDGLGRASRSFKAAGRDGRRNQVQPVDSRRRGGRLASEPTKRDSPDTNASEPTSQEPYLHHYCAKVDDDSDGHSFQRLGGVSLPTQDDAGAGANHQRRLADSPKRHYRFVRVRL